MKKETEMAKKVIEWLNSQHWEVYQEVKIGSSIADIVSIQGKLIWIIECKLNFSLDLIGQALEWRRDANFVSIAIPKQKRRYISKARRVGYQILRNYGIGLIEIVNLNADINHQKIEPKLNRKPYSKLIKDSLCEKQKYWVPAGTCGGGYWTPFQETCRNVEKIVKTNPGIILKDLIDNLKHHYASDISARASISHWVKKGVINGVEYKKEGRYLRFYPEEINETNRKAM